MRSPNQDKVKYIHDLNFSVFDFELLRVICRFYSGVNLAYLVNYIKNLNNSTFEAKSKSALYMRLYRSVKHLEGLKLIKIGKIDGLIWITPEKTAVDLIKLRSKTQTFLKLRDFALILLSRRKFLSVRDKERLSNLFLGYLKDISSKWLVLEAKEDLDIFPTYLVKPYSTRFNSKKRLKVLLERYNEIWDYAVEHFKFGVFLTLTADPKRFSSLFGMFKAVSKGFNRFMSLLRRRFGFRPPYVCVQEFSDKGFLHLHVVVFGVSRLMDKREITKFWKKYGVGEINFVYKLVNRGGSFVWAKSKPRKTKEKSLKKYLFKYLAKNLWLIRDLSQEMSFFSDIEGLFESKEVFKLALYWASRKRFYTYSFCLVKPRLPFRLGLYRFYGVFRLEQIYDFILADCVFLNEVPNG